MTLPIWRPEGSEVVEAEDLKIRLARELTDCIRDRYADLAKLIECRKLNDLEIVSFSLQLELPQRPEYPFHDYEVISVLYSNGETAPAILVAREDFPDTPHQSMVARGFPYQLCVDDRPWEDVKSNYTAEEILQRTASWFAKAAQGELHDARQPLDPTVFGNSFEIVFRLATEDENRKDRDLAVYRYDEEAKYLFVEPRNPGKEHSTTASFNLIQCALNPTHMKRMRHAPANLNELAEMLHSGGCDLMSKLKDAVDAWQGFPDQTQVQNAPYCFLVTMPILHPKSGDTGAVSTIAFITDKSAGEVAELLGFVFRNVADTGQIPTYSPQLFGSPGLENASEVNLFPGIVHHDFDSGTAAVYSGRKSTVTERALLVGAGSLGSAIAESLVREGLFRWTILDDDVLMPHNLARHTLDANSLGQPKARMLAQRMRMIRHDSDPRAVIANLFDAERDDVVKKAFEDADLIIDASASVPAARTISDWDTTARRVSAFFTPDGRSAVLMIEDMLRKYKLRDLEAMYLREVLVNKELENHLSPVELLPYAGACRAVTNRIPASRIQMLAGLISSGISDGISDDNADIRIWQFDATRQFRQIKPSIGASYIEAKAWTIVMPDSLVDALLTKRREAQPNETGGTLLGLVDIEKNRVDILDALPAPEDSQGRPHEFIRGTRGLFRAVHTAIDRTGGLARYIGEWHSHPPGASVRPSETDLAQLAELSVILQVDGVPAITLIVGEDGVGINLAENLRPDKTN